LGSVGQCCATSEDSGFWLGKETGGNHDVFLDTKGGWGLCALRSSNKKGKKLEVCIRKESNYENLDEAKFLDKLTICEISEIDVDGERT